MWAPSKRTICAMSLILGLLCTYFHAFYVAPSTSRILFLQTVTMTKKVPLQVFAQYDPTIAIPCVFPVSFCSVFQSVFSDEELATMKQAAQVALGRDPASGKHAAHPIPLQAVGGALVDASRIVPQDSSSVDDDLVGATRRPTNSTMQMVTVPPQLRNSHLRFTTKHHISSQIQELWHYPVAFILCTKVGLCNVPWITANVITMVHLAIGILCGLCFFRASKHWEYGVTHLGRQVTGDLDSDEDGVLYTPKTDVANVDAVDSACDSTPISAQKRLGRTMSVTSIKQPPAASYFEAPIELVDTVGDTEITSMASMASSQTVLYEGTTQRRRWILLATALFATRNMLDTLDGVVARYHRMQATHGDMSRLTVAPLVFGSNGHTLDTVCDFLGGFAACLGILSIMWSQPVLISRFWRLVMAKIGLRQTIRHHPKTPKSVAFLGLFFTSVAASGWDYVMLNHCNLFDVHADGSDAIFALEQSFQVRLLQFLWSMTCADTLFTMITWALVLDKLWPLLQLLVFVGYPWFVVLMGYSLYVWYFVVRQTPEAASLLGWAPRN